MLTIEGRYIKEYVIVEYSLVKLVINAVLLIFPVQMNVQLQYREKYQNKDISNCNQY